MIDVSAKFKADMAKNNKLLSNIEVTVKRDDENILHKKIFSHGKKNLVGANVDTIHLFTYKL